MMSKKFVNNTALVEQSLPVLGLGFGPGWVGAYTHEGLKLVPLNGTLGVEGEAHGVMVICGYDCQFNKSVTDSKLIK